jgi:thiol-disulfide isomerase/thioredoxin
MVGLAEVDQMRWCRWLLAALVVAIAVGVAMWPRQETAPDSRTARGQTSQLRSAPPVSSGDGQRASHPNCPEPSGSQLVSGELVGVFAPCLGSTDPIDLGRALAGEPALLNVWASWCAPCREEMPVLNAYSESEDSIRVLGVNVDTDTDTALRLMAELGVVFPSFGVSDALRDALDGPPVLPLSFVLHADGTVTPVRPLSAFHDVEQVHNAVIAATP